MKSIRNVPSRFGIVSTTARRTCGILLAGGSFLILWTCEEVYFQHDYLYLYRQQQIQQRQRPQQHLESQSNLLESIVTTENTQSSSGQSYHTDVLETLRGTSIAYVASKNGVHPDSMEVTSSAAYDVENQITSVLMLNIPYQASDSLLPMNSSKDSRGSTTPAIRRTDSIFKKSSYMSDPENSFGGVWARPYKPWWWKSPRSNDAEADIHRNSTQIRKRSLLPCIKPEPTWSTMAIQSTPTTTGLLFVKPYKTASSTGAGLHLRIARNAADRQHNEQSTHAQDNWPICQCRFDHGPFLRPAYTLNYGNRDRKRSYLWTIIRDPTERAISFFFFFYVSRKKLEPSDAQFKQYLLNDRRTTSRLDASNRTITVVHDLDDLMKLGQSLETTQDYYIETLSTKKYLPRPAFRETRKRSISPQQKRFHSDPIAFANEILDDYNFIAISERLDESAVVLMHLLGVPMSDILFLNAKGHGRHYDDGMNSKCTYIWPSFVSPSIKEFFASKQWQDRIRYDEALYSAANRSLDLTIDYVIGRSVFDDDLKRYRKAQALGSEKCSLVAKFPCTEAGVFVPREKTDCIWKDSACGTGCLDEIATELNLW
jgi:hypothetical protein